MRNKATSHLVKGQVIFEHHDDKAAIKPKSEKGDDLNITFNNTEGTIKAYLNGGEQFDVVEQKSASGILKSIS